MIEKLACKLGRNDELPNIELAQYLCETRCESGIEEIVGGLKEKDTAIVNDCIKVLYEIGARNPEMICDYADEFVSCLSSKNNRLIWGAMTALALIAGHAHGPVFERLPEIVSAYERGSVITVDNSISVFAELCKADKSYENAVLPIMIDHLKKCRAKEVPQHFERASVCINFENVGVFTDVLESRKPDLTPPQQARINKLTKKLGISQK